jgi:hypothetical protein
MHEIDEASRITRTALVHFRLRLCNATIPCHSLVTIAVVVVRWHCDCRWIMQSERKFHEKVINRDRKLLKFLLKSEAHSNVDFSRVTVSF